MQPTERNGLLLALIGFATLSVGDTVIKTMQGSWSPIAVAALRFAIGSAGLAALLWWKEGAAGFRPRQPILQLGRGFCLAAATLFFFSAIFNMQLDEAMAIAFTAPVFTALFSGPLLGEKVRPAVWISLIAALAGVAIVLRPNLIELGWVALLPLGSAFFFALMVIANRASAGQGSALSMQAYIAIVATPFLAAAAWLGHVSGAEALEIGAIDWTILARCAFVAVTASTAHWLVFLGTERAGASSVAPMSYVQMLVVIVMGWLFFSDTPDSVTLLGAAIIIGAGLYLWWDKEALAKGPSD